MAIVVIWMVFCVRVERHRLGIEISSSETLTFGLDADTYIGLRNGHGHHYLVISPVLPNTMYVTVGLHYFISFNGGDIGPCSSVDLVAAIEHVNVKLMTS